MKYREFWQPYREHVQERFPLLVERLEQMTTEETTVNPFRTYFQHTALFLRELCSLEEEIYQGAWEDKSQKEWKDKNQELYQEILPECYETSYGNPAYAAEQLGESYGKLLGMLYADIRSLTPYAFEGRNFELTIFGELLVEIYNCFEQEKEPAIEEIRNILYWFFHDYGEIFT